MKLKFPMSERKATELRKCVSFAPLTQDALDELRDVNPSSAQLDGWKRAVEQFSPSAIVSPVLSNSSSPSSGMSTLIFVDRFPPTNSDGSAVEHPLPKGDGSPVRRHKESSYTTFSDTATCIDKGDSFCNVRSSARLLETQLDNEEGVSEHRDDMLKQYKEAVESAMASTNWSVRMALQGL